MRAAIAMLLLLLLTGVARADEAACKHGDNAACKAAAAELLAAPHPSRADRKKARALYARACKRHDRAACKKLGPSASERRRRCLQRCQEEETVCGDPMGGGGIGPCPCRCD
jgi:hypothetical protein